MKLLRNAKRIALGFLVTACLVCLFSCQTMGSASKKEPHAASEDTHKNARIYHAMAEGVTKQCPIEVDEATTLTKLEYKEDQHALAYTYLFSGGVYEDMDKQTWAIVEKTAEGMLKEKLKTNQMIYQIRKDKVTLIYIYTDQNGKELFSVIIHPGEY